MICLEVVSTPKPPKTEVTPGGLTIGRQGAHLIVNDEACSRRHARVFLTNTGWTIEDLGSKNGTYVNGKRVNKASLKAGDKIRVGNTLFQVSPTKENSNSDTNTQVIHSWPELLQSLPKEKQEDFSAYR